MVSSPGGSPGPPDDEVKDEAKWSVREVPYSANAEDERVAGERAPWWTGMVLCAAILAVSSAAAAFRTIDGAAPITRAGWRLQVTSLAVSPLAYAQWRRMAPDLRHRAWQPTTLGVLALSGACLAVHFGAWVYSIDHTSLPHALVLVCSSPLILAIAYLLTCHPISGVEVAGVALGMGGAALLALSAKSDKEITLGGDAAAFLAAAAFCVYITCGKKLRGWLPLFCYTLPVSVVAALLLSSAGVLLEGVGGQVDGKLTGVVAYLTHPAYLLPIIYLALGPGIVGHAGLNAVLRYMSPLSLSLAVGVEPLLGSLLGWGMHVSGLPGLFTWVGGVLLIVATILTQVAGQQRQDGDEKHPEELVLVPLANPSAAQESTEDEDAVSKQRGVARMLYKQNGAVKESEKDALLEEGTLK